MSLVRCSRCREIVDAGLGRDCPACGNILPEPRADEQLWLPEAQQEAMRDGQISTWFFVFLGIMGIVAVIGIDWKFGILMFVFVGLIALWMSRYGQPASAKWPPDDDDPIDAEDMIEIVQFVDDAEDESHTVRRVPRRSARRNVVAGDRSRSTGAQVARAAGVGGLGMVGGIVLGILIGIAVIVGTIISFFVSCLNELSNIGG